MIPKVIHYCWFGGKALPEKAQKCIASWKKYCPDYQIIQWDETNFDVNRTAYTAYCYQNKKYAFLSDYVRLLLVYENGGLYFDTDVELLRSPDALLGQGAFFGFENDQFVATGLGFGAIAGHASVKAMLDLYDRMVPASDGSFELIVCPALNTQALLPFGLKQNGSCQTFQDITVYSAEYFNPYDDATGRLMKTGRTVSVHWYSKSWMSGCTVLRSKLTRPFHRLFGKDCFARFKR